MKRSKIKKKLKCIEFELKFPMFRANCIVVVCDNLHMANRELRFTEDDLSNAAGYTNTNFINGWALLMLEPTATIEEIAHESNHFLNAMFAKMGYVPDRDNDEVESYLLGYICKKIHGYIKKHKKKYN